MSKKSRGSRLGSEEDSSLHVVGCIPTNKKLSEDSRLTSFLLSQKKCFEDDDDEVFEEEETRNLKANNQRRIEEMLQKAKQDLYKRKKEESCGSNEKKEVSTSSMGEKADALEKHKNKEIPKSTCTKDSKSNAFELLRKMEWLRNQADHSEFGRSCINKNVDNTTSVQSLPQKNENSEEYFSGTKQMKNKGKRRNKQEMVISLQTLEKHKQQASEATNGHEYLWGQQSASTAGYPSNAPKRPISCWEKKSGTDLFSDVPKRTLSVYGSEGMSEEEMVKLAIAESLKTHEVEKHRIIDLKEYDRTRQQSHKTSNTVGVMQFPPPEPIENEIWDEEEENNFPKSENGRQLGSSRLGKLQKISVEGIEEPVTRVGRRDEFTRDKYKKSSESDICKAEDKDMEESEGRAGSGYVGRQRSNQRYASHGSFDRREKYDNKMTRAEETEDHWNRGNTSCMDSRSQHHLNQRPMSGKNKSSKWEDSDDALKEKHHSVYNKANVNTTEEDWDEADIDIHSENKSLYNEDNKLKRNNKRIEKEKPTNSVTHNAHSLKNVSHDEHSRTQGEDKHRTEGRTAERLISKESADSGVCLLNDEESCHGDFLETEKNHEEEVPERFFRFERGSSPKISEGLSTTHFQDPYAYKVHETHNLYEEHVSPFHSVSSSPLLSPVSSGKEIHSTTSSINSAIGINIPTHMPNMHVADPRQLATPCDTQQPRSPLSLQTGMSDINSTHSLPTTHNVQQLPSMPSFQPHIVPGGQSLATSIQQIPYMHLFQPNMYEGSIPSVPAAHQSQQTPFQLGMAGLGNVHSGPNQNTLSFQPSMGGVDSRQLPTKQYVPNVPSFQPCMTGMDRTQAMPIPPTSNQQLSANHFQEFFEAYVREHQQVMNMNRLCQMASVNSTGLPSPQTNPEMQANWTAMLQNNALLNAQLMNPALFLMQSNALLNPAFSTLMNPALSGMDPAALSSLYLPQKGESVKMPVPGSSVGTNNASLDASVPMLNRNIMFGNSLVNPPVAADLSNMTQYHNQPNQTQQPSVGNIQNLMQQMTLSATSQLQKPGSSSKMIIGKGRGRSSHVN